MKFEKILEYVKNSPWPDDIDHNIVINQAYKVYEEITKNKDKEKKLYRICGQTGSGKTRQLLKSLEMYMEFSNKNPVVLGVRTCASYHPLYSELLKKYGNGNIREITNGFALKCMSYVLKLLIENNYLILLDITLLDPIYEEYVLELLKVNDYFVEYHIMAVNKVISDSFIEKRYKDTGRIVKKESCEYFNYILDKGLGYLVNKDDKNNCYIWNAYDCEFKFYGPIKDCLPIFKKEREIIKEPTFTEEVLLKSKYKIIVENSEN